MTEQCAACSQPFEPGANFCPYCREPARPAVTVAVSTKKTGADRPGKNRLAMLVVKRGSHVGLSAAVSDKLRVGSAGGNDFVVSDSGVSAHHAVIRREDGVHVFHDLASLNGSFLVKQDGSKEKIGAPLHLMHGDTIEIGRTRLVYLQEVGR